jgi:hypothetical protein
MPETSIRNGISDGYDGFPLPEHPKVTSSTDHAFQRKLNRKGGHMDPVPEIRREKVFLQPGMATQEIMKTYGLSSDQAYKARVKGFFVKNYSKKQIVIDRENFNSAVVYPLAKKIFAKNFKWNPLAQSIYDDMIQEAVTRLFELSGKTKEMANGKYSENYANFWIAHNAMLAFLKTWERQNKWCLSFQDEADPILRGGKRAWSPEWGWMYV